MAWRRRVVTAVACRGVAKLIVFLLIRQNISNITFLLLLYDTVQHLQHTVLLRREPEVVILTIYF